MNLRVSLLLAVFILSLIQSPPKTFAQDSYTPQQYIKDRRLKSAKIIPAGSLKIDGTRMICGRRPTVLDSTFNDYGGAFNGFIILNPRLLKRLPRQVKLWIYSHECAHQFRGGDEAVADCFAIERGVRRKWLTSSGMKKICKFIWSAPATEMHAAGPKRCEMMKRCFKKVSKKKRK